MTPFRTEYSGGTNCFLIFDYFFNYLDCTKCKFPDFSLNFPNIHFFLDLQQNSLAFPWLLPSLEFPWLFPDRWTPWFCISLSVLNISGAQAWMFQENNVKTCDALVHCFTKIICCDDIQNVGQAVLYLTLIMLIPLSTTCALLVSKNNRKCQHNLKFPQTNSAHTRLPVPGNSLSQSPCIHLWGLVFNTLRQKQNGRLFPDDNFKCIFLNENVWISVKISLKFVTKGPINNNPTLVEIMAWRRPGDKPLSKPLMVRLPTHISITWLQWVNTLALWKNG